MVVLTVDEREAFEERAAIMEHHGDLDRKEAERKALEDILRIRERKENERKNHHQRFSQRLVF